MKSKVIEVGYGKVRKVKIGGGNKLVLIGGPVLSKIETMHL